MCGDNTLLLKSLSNIAKYSHTFSRTKILHSNKERQQKLLLSSVMEKLVAEQNCYKEKLEKLDKIKKPICM